MTHEVNKDIRRELRRLEINKNHRKPIAWDLVYYVNIIVTNGKIQGLQGVYNRKLGYI
jgi:hypothetical protein